MTPELPELPEKPIRILSSREKLEVAAFCTIMMAVPYGFATWLERMKRRNEGEEKGAKR